MATTSITTSGATALSGVFSGIDTSVLIQQAIAVASKPLNRLQTRKTQAQTRQSYLQSLQGNFTSLQSQANSLRDIASIRGVSASSSDQAVVSLSASAGAIEGSYDVEVNQLAAAERKVHAGVASKTDVLGSPGQFVYSYNGTTRTIQTSGTTTLEGLAALINNDSSNPGVVASIIHYDSGDGLAYHLVLGGRNTGADHAITVEAQTTLAGFGPGGDWTVSQAARNAQVRLDGYPAGGWIQSDSNSVSGLIPNVTLNLGKIGSASVSLSRDTSSLKSGLSNLVSIYNRIVDTLDTLAGYNATTKTGGVFQGDSTVTGLIAGARALMVQVRAGFVEGTDPYTSPSLIGLDMDKQGHLSVDSDKLNQALADNHEAVLSLVAASGSGGVSSSDIQFTSALSSTTPGSYQLKVVYDGDGNIAEAYYRTDDQTSQWRAATVNGNEITGASGSPEQGLNIMVVTPQPGQTMTYDVQVKQGFAGALHDITSAQLDPANGTFAVKSGQLDTEISSLDKQIAFQQDRLAKREATLRAQYSRMEAALAKMDSMKSAVDALTSAVANTWNTLSNSKN